MLKSSTVSKIMAASLTLGAMTALASPKFIIPSSMPLENSSVKGVTKVTTTPIVAEALFFVATIAWIHYTHGWIHDQMGGKAPAKPSQDPKSFDY